MVMSRRRREQQGSLWVSPEDLSTPGHPFYERLNAVLHAAEFDDFVETRCEPFYARKGGRPSVPPGVYFRMLFVGYFERLDSERGICWRCGDSLSLRKFLGLSLDEAVPDHSSLSRIRTRLPLEVHQEIFDWALEVIASCGLVDGKTVGVDSTTLEANAALRSIVRRDTGQGYTEFLEDLAKDAGIEKPERTDLAKIDKNRKGKGSNKDWVSPSDPDSQITRMKDGRTHLAHKAEHAVDLSGKGAVLAVTLHGGVKGDCATLPDTLDAAQRSVQNVTARSDSANVVHANPLSEVVADKGYHSNATMVALAEAGRRSYVSEPDRGPRRWASAPEAQKPTYDNRRRIQGDRGKRLLRKRGELLERPFAHYLEAGGMRRTHLRRHGNILKRLLIHIAGFNLGILMRNLYGSATPKALADALRALHRALIDLLGEHLGSHVAAKLVSAVLLRRQLDQIAALFAIAPSAAHLETVDSEDFSTGC